VPTSNRSPEEIQREIADERSRIEATLNQMGSDVDDLVTELRQNAIALGRRALVIAPVVGAVVGAMLTALLLRRRRKKRAAAD